MTEHPENDDGPRFGSLADLHRWALRAPASVSMPVRDIAALLAPLLESEPKEGRLAPIPSTWRERVWTCPPQTRMTAAEVAEAIGAPISRVYGWTHRTENPELLRRRREQGRAIPFRKVDGALVFLAGEVRDWLRERAEGERDAG